MKWARKTSEFQYADYVSEDGLYKIRDMSIHNNAKYWEHVQNGGKKSEYWALLDSNENIICWNSTVKKLKEYAEAHTEEVEEYCRYCGTRKMKGFLCMECGRI